MRKSFSDTSLTRTRVIACQMCFLAVITGSAGLFASRRTLRLRFWSSSLLNPHLRIRFIRRRRKDSLACRFVDSYLRILSHLSTCRDTSAANMRGCCLGGANEPRGNFLALDYFTRQEGPFNSWLGRRYPIILRIEARLSDSVPIEPVWSLIDLLLCTTIRSKASHTARLRLLSSNEL